MKTNNKITLFTHTNDGLKRSVFSAYVREILKTRFESGGADRADVLSVRIPTEEKIDVNCGDYVEIGETETRSKAAYTVSEVADNRAGSAYARHVRISAVR